MARGKLINRFSFSVNRGVVRKSVHVSGVRRQAGFSLVELVIVLAIIAIIAGFAIIGIASTLAGMRANKAMYQVVESMRDARMLAMSQQRRVSMQFTANNAVTVLIRNDAGVFTSVSDFLSLAYDPSTILENGHQFMNGNSYGDTTDGFGYEGAIVFSGSPVNPGDPPDRTFIFTEDGYLTEDFDLHQPINGTIFIGLPGGEERLMRAVTILGATGRIRSYQWRNNGWQLSR